MQDPDWNLEMPQTPSRSTPRRAHEHGHGYRAPHWLLHTRRRWTSALAQRACARVSTPASPTATCTPRPPDGPLLHTPFVLRTVPTAHVCARPSPLHQISRPRLDIGLVYRSSAQVAAPHAPFLGAALPAALARVSRFIRSHTECTRLEIGLVRRTTRIAPARLVAPRAPFVLRTVPALLASTSLARPRTPPYLRTPSPYTAASAHLVLRALHPPLLARRSRDIPVPFSSPRRTHHFPPLPIPRHLPPGSARRDGNGTSLLLHRWSDKNTYAVVARS
jgi:hypothetical protein